MSKTETLRESTWRERQEARLAAIAALGQLIDKKQELAQVQQEYRDALEAEKEAVQRNVDAWKRSGG